MRGLFNFIFFFITAILLFWVWAPQDAIFNRKEIVAYPGRCAENTTLKNCKILTLNRSRYRINEVRAEIVYDYIGFDWEPHKLINCAIISRSDWSCTYDDGSGKTVFTDGIEALSPAEHDGQKYFYMRKWQWWTAHLLSVFTWPIEGRILIPKQHTHSGV